MVQIVSMAASLAASFFASASRYNVPESDFIVLEANGITTANDFYFRYLELSVPVKLTIP